MRIVIDLQGNQSTGSRNRGIGRYSQALSYHICQHAGEHEVHLVLNGGFSHCIASIKADFADVLPAHRIHVFDIVSPSYASDDSLVQNRQFNEAMREAFIGALNPDMVLVTSLFEGLGDDTITSVNSYTRLPTAVVLYDLIPYLYQKPYLENPVVKKWYLNKLNHATRADLLLSISEASGQDAIKSLGIPAEQVVNISTACDSHFQPIAITADDRAYFAQTYQITKPFVMYTGGIDHRKNIDGLLHSYADLPAPIRQAHQLVIVCSIQPNEHEHLTWVAHNAGLADEEFIFTGFVPDEDLVKLYNACKLFIFPSWHEGFGLPALEAMQCGSAVIASNNSSLPEVVGLAEALFDPLDKVSITQKLLQALTDENFRQSLIQHGLVQAKKFNWHTIAKNTLQAFETFHQQHTLQNSDVIRANYQQPRPRLAYISPLPLLRSGISDYSAELLMYLTRWYDITTIVTQEMVADDWIQANIPIESVAWFRQHSQQFDRVLYHVGNSEFHQHMFDLIHELPGVMVLHDFYLSNIQLHRNFLDEASHIWHNNLYHSHGYGSVAVSTHPQYQHEAMWTYPTNLQVIQDALGVIVHSESSRKLARQWYGDDLSLLDWRLIPLLRQPPVVNDKATARLALGIDKNAFMVCSFGILGITKCTLKLVQAFIDSKLAQNKNCYLYIVGKHDVFDYGQQIDKLILSANMTDRIKITGWTDNEVFRQYLQATDIGVQLRTLSRGETSGTVLDCMNYGLPTISNANGSMADIDPECVYQLPDEFDISELSTALETLYTDASLRQRLGKKAQHLIHTQHSPAYCASLYYDAIESIYRQQANNLYGLIQKINQGTLTITSQKASYLATLANNFPAQPYIKQIFVDISELVNRDSKTGIQRVVRAILSELLKNPPAGYRIEPVYATQDGEGYTYARQFIAGFLDISLSGIGGDEAIHYHQGDIFLGLDLQPTIVPSQYTALKAMQLKGVKISFIVYDLIALTHPEFFAKGMEGNITNWLTTIAQFDQLIGISKSTADVVASWLRTHSLLTSDTPLRLDWFHLGSDIQTSKPSTGLPKNSQKVLDTLQARPTFLMVGTIEPRKGYQQVLLAFEQLWQNNTDINLVMVGKQGWHTDDFIDAIRQHKQLNKRLFWLEDTSDDYLEKIYKQSNCLIAASYTEGFGLPLIEAAQYQLPILARDIAVFREVAQASAVYFEDSVAPDVIATAVQQWLTRYANGKLPNIQELPILTWQQSTQQLLDILLEKVPSYQQL